MKDTFRAELEIDTPAIRISDDNAKWVHEDPYGEGEWVVFLHALTVNDCRITPYNPTFRAMIGAEGHKQIEAREIELTEARQPYDWRTEARIDEMREAAE
jgi:hypothetical protein